MRRIRSRKSQPRVITKDELKDKLIGGEAVQLVNVAEPKHHALGIILGSLKIPYAELSARIVELAKSRQIVTYCSDSSCDRSRMAAELLLKKGYQVRWYDGGIREWAAAGLPTE